MDSHFVQSGLRMDFGLVKLPWVIRVTVSIRVRARDRIRVRVRVRRPV